MIYLHASEQLLKQAAHEYGELSNRFTSFTTDIFNQLSSPHSIYKGVVCDKPAENGMLKIEFCGKVVLLVFGTYFGDKKGMQGCVKVYLSSQFPEQKITEINSFTFDRLGRTNLTAPDNDQITIDSDLASLSVGLNFVVQSLNYL